MAFRAHSPHSLLPSNNALRLPHAKTISQPHVLHKKWDSPSDSWFRRFGVPGSRLTAGARRMDQAVVSRQWPVVSKGKQKGKGEDSRWVSVRAASAPARVLSPSAAGMMP